MDSLVVEKAKLQSALCKGGEMTNVSGDLEKLFADEARKTDLL